MPLITQSEAARLLDVSKQAVHKAVTSGRLTGHSDSKGRVLIDSLTMREEWQRNTQKRIGQGPKSPGNASTRPISFANLTRTEETIPDYDESRARTEHLKAELLELERKQKEQILVKSEDVEATWVEIITLARTKILGIPTKAKQRIPDLDTDAISLLDDIVRETLEDIAATPKS